MFNSSSSLEALHEAIRALDLGDEERVRPNWDQYFMQLASLAAQRSNCMKRRVGCVLVRERRVISTGYNGTPRNLKNCNEGGCKIQFQAPRALAGPAVFPQNISLPIGRPKVQSGRRWGCWPINLPLSSCRRKCIAGGWKRAHTRRCNSLL